MPIEDFLPENGSIFPAKIKVLRGLTLSKRQYGWWKAICLVETTYGNKSKTQVRLYGWQWDKKNKQWKQRQKFNISSGIEETLISILNETTEHGKIGLRKHGIAGTIRDIIEGSLGLMSKRKVEQIKEETRRDELPLMAAAISEFEELLNSNPSERQIQRFLTQNPWMLGPYYTKVREEQWAGMKGRNDFVLERDNGLYDIVELKKSTALLFKKDKENMIISAQLAGALSQMARYLAYYQIHYLSQYAQTKIDIYMPRGIILIGRSNPSNKKILQDHLNIFDRNIEIITYDDILVRSRQTLRTIKGLSTKPKRRIRKQQDEKPIVKDVHGNEVESKVPEVPTPELIEKKQL